MLINIDHRRASKKPERPRIGCALLALAAVAVTLSGCASLTPPRAAATTGTYRLVQEPEAGYQPLLDLLHGARQTIRMTMYELTDRDVIGALIAAHRRGATTRLILDDAFHGRAVNTAAFDQLQSAGVDVRWAPASIIYHQKTFTVDAAIAAIGTGNLTKSHTGTRDAYILDTDPSDVAAIDSTFDADYAATDRGHPPSATQAANLIWSPDARAQFLRHIEAATTSLDITSEEFKDHAVVEAIAHTARRGVACRVLLTDSPAWHSALDTVTTAGCTVHLVPAQRGALYMHEKLLLIDDTTLILGSHNLTTTSLIENRELSITLTATNAAPVLAAVKTTFDNDFRSAQ
jgi:phosphatidylserine/phosphatidylglycerophosphate/cardiolipin synthase-like enzyme